VAHGVRAEDSYQALQADIGFQVGNLLDVKRIRLTEKFSSRKRAPDRRARISWHRLATPSRAAHSISTNTRTIEPLNS
jgi:hypothetical protein